MKGVADVTCDSVHTVMDTCTQKLLTFGLNGCFTLTMSRFSHKKNLYKHIIAMHEEI